MLISLVIVELQKIKVYALISRCWGRHKTEDAQSEKELLLHERDYNIFWLIQILFYIFIIPKPFLSVIIDYFCKEDRVTKSNINKQAVEMCLCRRKINKNITLPVLRQLPCYSTSCHHSRTFPDISACPSDNILPTLT